MTDEYLLDDLITSKMAEKEEAALTLKPEVKDLMIQTDPPLEEPKKIKIAKAIIRSRSNFDLPPEPE